MDPSRTRITVASRCFTTCSSLQMLDSQRKYSITSKLSLQIPFLILGKNGRGEEIRKGVNRQSLVLASDTTA